MTGTSSIINLGDLSKPATVLIEKISEAIGGIFRPFQIKRIANAQAEASIIEARTAIEINEIQKRALNRFVNEETIKQINMENITCKAINLLHDLSEPENLDSDWLTYFFDKARNISTLDAQNFWARVLSGEVNKPKSFSKKTLSILYELDSTDAMNFSKLCSFCCKINDDPHLFILMKKDKDKYFEDKGIKFDLLNHLANMQLINYEPSEHFEVEFHEGFALEYFDDKVIFSKNNIYVNCGRTLFTNAGLQLFTIATPVKYNDFFQFVINDLVSKGFKLKTHY